MNCIIDRILRENAWICDKANLLKRELGIDNQKSIHKEYKPKSNENKGYER